MGKTRVALYARCSLITGQQDPENQLVHLRRFSEQREYEVHDEYVDFASGAKERRPSLDRLLTDARSGKFKIILVAALDRLGRDTRNLLNLLHELSGYKCAVISLRENIDFSSSIGQATLTILSVIGSMERIWIGERISQALAAKKLSAERTGSGWRCGRTPVATPEVVAEVMSLREKGLSIRGIEKILLRKISRASISRILKDNRSVSETSN